MNRCSKTLSPHTQAVPMVLSRFNVKLDAGSSETKEQQIERSQRSQNRHGAACRDSGHQLKLQ
eukprot:2300656-Amphidinium_carterae.2